jgi:hypothetical protein
LSPEPYSAEEREIARDILRYLEKHPEAKDTLEGIVQWWLSRERVERRLTKVERAVSFLLFQDLILETRRIGLPPYYRLNHEKEKEIVEILKDL